MVVRANRSKDGIGGHISTYQSIATLYEVGFNHFSEGKRKIFREICLFSRSPRRVYMRAYLEGA